ncbi:MAG: hypothetical protein PUK70_02455 [Bacteroidales bacterium]|nr:hypothetical protein [Bacteroidales bacterium]
MIQDLLSASLDSGSSPDYGREHGHDSLNITLNCSARHPELDSGSAVRKARFRIKSGMGEKAQGDGWVVNDLLQSSCRQCVEFSPNAFDARTDTTYKTLQ